MQGLVLLEFGSLKAAAPAEQWPCGHDTLQPSQEEQT